jgi:hypothetical protein
MSDSPREICCVFCGVACIHVLRRRTWTIPGRWALAGVIVVVPMLVVMRMVSRGSSALTGRIGRHSTAGLAVVAAASLVLAQLDEGVGRSHPQLGSEGGVVGGPVGEEGPWAWSRPRFLGGLWHNANTTTNAVAAPVRALLLAGLVFRGDQHHAKLTAEDLPDVVQSSVATVRARMLAASRSAASLFGQRRRASVRLGSSGIIVITRLGCQPVERMPSG